MIQILHQKRLFSDSIDLIWYLKAFFLPRKDLHQRVWWVADPTYMMYIGYSEYFGPIVSSSLFNNYSKYVGYGK